MAKHPKGIAPLPDGTGWRVYVRVRGVFRSRIVRPPASPADLQRERDRLRADAWDAAPPPAPAPPPVPTFAEDADAYLKAVKGMASYSDREQHILEWVAEFGPRPRSTITAADVRAVLERRRVAGAAASSLNHRRTAIQHLYAVLDGKAERSVIRDVPRYREPRPQPRAIPYAVIRAILAKMRPSATRARLAVIAATGIPHASLMRMTAEHVHEASVWVPGREKGRGTEGQHLPLTPAGVAAFKELAQWDAWGPFSTQSMYKSFQLACGKFEPPLTGLRPYDLRHSFGTAAYQASGDIHAVQVLMHHSSAKLTARYTQAAVDPRLILALKGVKKLQGKLQPSKRGRRS